VPPASSDERKKRSLLHIIYINANYLVNGYIYVSCFIEQGSFTPLFTDTAETSFTTSVRMVQERAVDSDSLLIFVHTSNMSSITRFLTKSAFPVLSRKFLHVRRHIHSVMAAALALNLLAFLLFSYLNSQSYCFNRRFSLNGHRSDTPRNALECSSTPYLDLCCFCRIRHFE